MAEAKALKIAGIAQTLFSPITHATVKQVSAGMQKSNSEVVSHVGRLLKKELEDMKQELKLNESMMAIQFAVEEVAKWKDCDLERKHEIVG